MLSRGCTSISGIFHVENGHGFVIPAKKNEETVFIRRKSFHGAKAGDRVTANIIHYPDNHNLAPEGSISEILAHSNNGEADILALIRAYDFQEKFPPEAEAEANQIASTVLSPEDTANRSDLRDDIVITIDGADAKDLDDAVSIQKKEDGTIILGVHIADVSHYVTAGSLLDREAFQRGNSTYLLTRVIPMLPKSISNGICSLFEGADRLTLSCFMTVKPDGEIIHHEIVPSMIRSKARLVYDDVSDMIENDDTELIQKYSNYHGFDIFHTLLQMKELAEILNRKRMQEGSLDFDIPEAKIDLDENEFAVNVSKEERRTANRIIEEFMLAANRTVAEHYCRENLPFVYRVHDKPDSDKTDKLVDFLKSCGYSGFIPNQLTPIFLQKVLEKARGKENAGIINYAVLHSMMKASYSTECRGHFGLAFQYYCHFTSPIRRYPDLLIHRFIHQYLDAVPTPSQRKKMFRIAEKAADHSSVSERRSQEIEREVDKMKKAEYLSKHLGEKFSGVISGIAEYGIFVTLPNTIEGMIRTSDLADDSYLYMPEKYRLVGEKSGRIFSISDPITVTVLSADPQSREIDFILAEE
ncbi:MAG: ribonuclease R [Eubacteriales bacterium]|nr:ribonuclease R [Eubacteriales bacterium]